MQKNSLKFLPLAGSLFLAACGQNQSENQAPNTENTSERPNIVVIMADDMGYSDLGFFGAEINTPNLDSLASQSLVMTNFYNTSRSCPTRASLLTGLYQHETGIGHMINHRGFSSYQGFLNDSCQTIAEVLKQAGYTTLLSGKWHVGSAPEHWPNQRGFDRFFGFPKGGGVYFYPFAKDRQPVLDGKPFEPDSSFYSTDAINQHAVEFVEQQKQSDKPFFLYIAHIAPHFPLQAHPGDIARYRGKYSKGFDFYRRKRFEEMKKRGIIPQDLKLSAPDERVKSWDELSPGAKDSFDLRMAVYAAQIECMDRGLGKVFDKLKETGKWENTVVMFLADNGGTHEITESWERYQHLKGEIGTRDSYASINPSWANVSNTPFRMYKHWVHEGGISTPLIVYYPRLIPEHRLDHQVAHVIDLVPTWIELAGAEYPEKANGKPIKPLRGKSLVPLIKGETWQQPRTLFWEHEGNRAVRKGDWKIVSKFPENQWELYHIKNDRTETNDLSARHPEKVGELDSLYHQWAKSAGVVPWQKILDKQKE